MKEIHAFRHLKKIQNMTNIKLIKKLAGTNKLDIEKIQKDLGSTPTTKYKTTQHMAHTILIAKKNTIISAYSFLLKNISPLL